MRPTSERCVCVSDYERAPFRKNDAALKQFIIKNDEMCPAFVFGHDG